MLGFALTALVPVAWNYFSGEEAPKYQRKGDKQRCD
jgi:hypothetical protein